MNAGRFADAQREARKVLARSPQHASALLLAGIAAEQQQDYQQALDYFARIAPDSPQYAAGLAFQGDLLFYHLGQPSEAERMYRQVLAVSPNDPFTLSNLGYLLGVHGRRWESVPYLQALVRQNRASHEQLLWLGVADMVIDNAQLLQQERLAAPEDPLPRLGLARLALRDNEPARAKELLAEVLRSVPQEIEAQARLGQALLALEQHEELVACHQALPPPSDDHPEIWVVRGQLARHRQEIHQAVRCFAEAVRLDPNHQPAIYQLAQLMAQVGEQPISDQLARRAARLVDLTQILAQLQAEPEHLPHMCTAAELLESLGRHWEAMAWASRALQLDGDVAWARQVMQRLSSQLTADAPFLHPNSEPLRNWKFADYALPDWRLPTPIKDQVTAAFDDVAAVHFSDLAPAAGLEFIYTSGEPANRFQAQLGGGVGVIDFDHDSWPDFHFTQGCDFDSRGRQETRLDQLFQNQAGERFRNVTTAARLHENQFSFGIAVGDFNDDGFADVLVGNIDKSRLWQNMGDGTFRDVTAESGIQGDAWTASCVIADLTSDRLPDIYLVNYLEGADLFTRPCPCTPGEYRGAPDRFYVNLGDGRFEDRTARAGMFPEPGKGLGIVAADFQFSGQLSLFVANDAVANSLFVPQGAPGSEIVFVDQGVASGVAFDQDGLVQSCMGVAAGDANADGRLDLFVTNFYRQSNTLYVQQPGLTFADETRRAGLRDPSYMLLGWGTQFIDGELDGYPDLVLANGHVEPRLHEPLHMRPQYFRNQGAGRFVEVARDALGDYFRRDYLGRGLARVDWNRDGREDFAVSNLEAPASLVTNQTAAIGKFISFQFRGTTSSRDAIGTTVYLTNDGKSWMQQLTAGDGYQASNERTLIFGLGECDRVENVTVRWPTGMEQKWDNLPANSAWLAIEGRPKLVRQAMAVTP